MNRLFENLCFILVVLKRIIFILLSKNFPKFKILNLIFYFNIVYIIRLFDKKIYTSFYTYDFQRILIESWMPTLLSKILLKKNLKFLFIYFLFLTAALFQYL